MIYLLDTQVALWLMLDDKRLPRHIKSALSDPDATAIFHQTSIWEVQIKYDLGKLRLPKAPTDLLPGWVEASGLRKANIEDRAIFMLGKLPALHRDPFDRLLIAHAIVNGWVMATVDKTIGEYPLSVM